MKNRLFLILLIWFAISALSLNIFVQNSPQSHLPEGVKARLDKGRINEIQYSPDSTRLAVASSIGIWSYDAQTGEELDLLTGHTGGIRSVVFSPNGRMLASGSSDETVQLWDAGVGRHIRTLTGHAGGIRSIMFSPNGNTLASGSADQTIRLWDVQTGRHIRTLTGHTSWVTSIAFSSNGNTLASGSRDSTVRLWNAEMGKHIRTFTGHTSWVTSVAFNPNGSTLASGGRDSTVRLWNAEMGKHIRTLTGHTGGVRSVVFSPNGNTLASGSADQTIRLWDVQTGRHIRTLMGHTISVTSVAFSPNGNTLASGSADGTVLLWELAPAPIKSKKIAEDVNTDGVVNIQDLVFVDSNFGKTGRNIVDVNNDGIVNIVDLTLVAGTIGNTAGASSAWRRNPEAVLTRAQVEEWLRQVSQMNLTGPTFQPGISVLEQLLTSLTPKETALLPNYPNPFNPETWIPYQLAEPADVSISIYTADGQLVRTLDLGHRFAGIYESRSRAAYWNGKNELGESVASGVYLYTLTAGEFTATGKMLIHK